MAKLVDYFFPSVLGTLEQRDEELLISISDEHEGETWADVVRENREMALQVLTGGLRHFLYRPYKLFSGMQQVLIGNRPYSARLDNIDDRSLYKYLEMLCSGGINMGELKHSGDLGAALVCALNERQSLGSRILGRLMKNGVIRKEAGKDVGSVSLGDLSVGGGALIRRVTREYAGQSWADVVAADKKLALRLLSSGLRGNLYGDGGDGSLLSGKRPHSSRFDYMNDAALAEFIGERYHGNTISQIDETGGLGRALVYALRERRKLGSSIVDDLVARGVLVEGSKSRAGIPRGKGTRVYQTVGVEPTKAHRYKEVVDCSGGPNFGRRYGKSLAEDSVNPR